MEKKVLSFEEKLARAEKWTSKIWVLVAGLLLVILAWLLVPMYLVSWLYSKNLPENAGIIGDMFGSVNALFAGLAMMLLIFSIFQTQKSIKIQQNELSLQRRELEESRKVLQDQAVSQEKMIEAIFDLAQQTKLAACVSASAVLFEDEKKISEESGVAKVSKIHHALAKDYRVRLENISYHIYEGIEKELLE